MKCAVTILLAVICLWPSLSVQAAGLPVLVDSEPILLDCSVDITSAGVIFAAVAMQADGVESIAVHRSLDGGDTWTAWGHITSGTGQVNLDDPDLVVAEGVEDRVFIVFAYSSSALGEIRLVSALVSADSPDFGEDEHIVVMHEPDTVFSRPRLVVDDDVHADYLLYCVAESADERSSMIWFTRSVDNVQLFEPEYMIAGTASDKYRFSKPDLAFGHAGFVHLTWCLDSVGGVFDDALMYRRAANRAVGGLSAWGGVRFLTGADNGVDEYAPRLAASSVDGRLVLVANRKQDNAPGGPDLPPSVMISLDHGADFSETLIPQSTAFMCDVAWDLAGDRWVFAGRSSAGVVSYRAPADDPSDWTVDENLEIDDALVPGVSLGIPLGAADSAALIWIETRPDEFARLCFTGEWRDAPGYPTEFDGFPVQLVATPSGAPAAADLDDDGRPEIIFATDDGWLHAVSHDGTEPEGWPTDMMEVAADGPVAAGLAGVDNTPLVVVGMAGGSAKGYRADGNITWLGESDTGPAYVSIGALGDSMPYVTVSVHERTMEFFEPTGFIPPGSYAFVHDADGTVKAPAAIGDVDGNGVAEAVMAFGKTVVAHEMTRPVATFKRKLDREVSGPVTLADFDRDGDQEICVPTITGYLYVLDDRGRDVYGWPRLMSSGALGEVAFGQILDGGAQEMVFADATGHLNLCRTDGFNVHGYPLAVGGEVTSGILLGDIGGAVDLLYAGVNGLVGVKSGAGGDRPGWPQFVGSPVLFTPMMVDLDVDGEVEVVWLTAETCQAVSIGRAADVAWRTWPTTRHDMFRSGCSDCTPGVLAPVGGHQVVTRVAFAGARPNPVSSASASFAFSLPAEAVVQLEIVDLRGRRLRLLDRSPYPAGDHVLYWDGRDGQGRNLASGQYLARLSVRGSGFADELIRKVTVLR